MSQAELIKELAQKYETRKFIDGDPSWFMHQVRGEENQEAMAFIASSLSYGSRKQFMPKIDTMLRHSGGDVHEWVKDGGFMELLPDNDACFYRLYTNRMMREMLVRLQQMYREHGTMKGFISGSRESRIDNRRLAAIDAVRLLTEYFNGSGGIIPKNVVSSCKRLCMFLRWMVRDNSPVDLGLWADIIDKRTLIMPLDTHVMQQADSLGLIATRTTSMSTALKLTKAVAEIFPDDPLKADFALFGLGVNE